jgi:hypothetical protein
MLLPLLVFILYTLKDIIINSLPDSTGDSHCGENPDTGSSRREGLFPLLVFILYTLKNIIINSLPGRVDDTNT